MTFFVLHYEGQQPEFRALDNLIFNKDNLIYCFQYEGNFILKETIEKAIDRNVLTKNFNYR